MSMFIYDVQSSPSHVATLRRFWANIFAGGIRQARQACKLSVEQAAEVAGMETSEWAAIEAGQVPPTTIQLHSMAGTLEISYDRLSNLVLLCRDAWEV